ncbi:MAG: ATP-binding protein [Candidatus Hydrogenedentota bacterium]
MDEAELLRRMTDIESPLTERKPSEKQSESIRKAICAFANDLDDHRKPGTIFVGLNDDGTCAGIEITDELVRILADMRSDGNILPMPRLSVERKTLNGCDLAVVLVHPSSTPPVRYKGAPYVRVGSSNRVASEAEVRVLSEKRRAWDLPYDLHPLTTATLDDLDLDWFRTDYLPSAVGEAELASNDRTSPDKLASLRFVTPSPEHQPTVLGMLVAGYDPVTYIPGAYVQFLRFDGDQLTDPIKDEKSLSGRIDHVLSELDDVLKAHRTVFTAFAETKTEVRGPDYPMPALQQITRNAILHRTYEATNAPVRILWFSDRIEIQNPGGPFGQVTRENFGQPGMIDYRNPHLAEALKTLGYVQRFGLGIQIAREEMSKNGNPDIEFTIETSHVLAILRRPS